MALEAGAYLDPPVHHHPVACRLARSVSDASDDARLDAMADVRPAHLVRRRPAADEDAGRWADPELDVPVKACLAEGAWCPYSERWLQAGESARYTQGEGQSAAR